MLKKTCCGALKKSHIGGMNGMAAATRNAAPLSQRFAPRSFQSIHASRIDATGAVKSEQPAATPESKPAANVSSVDARRTAATDEQNAATLKNNPLPYAWAAVPNCRMVVLRPTKTAAQMTAGQSHFGRSPAGRCVSTKRAVNSMAPTTNSAAKR